MGQHIIYFDNNATTQTDERVVEAMLPYFTNNFGNPSSHHFMGEESKKTVEHSRSAIASFIDAETKEIIFTSGATEAINLAIKGIAEKYSTKGNHIITTQTEHSAVLDVCKYLEGRGFEIDYLPVDKQGLIDLAQLDSLIKQNTLLVSIIYVNNETGVMQPIEKIAEICKSKNVFFFTDTTQAVGKIPINVKKQNIDLMSFSGHKFYGPKGVGGLYCNKNIKLQALLHGGGHENGLRSGTLNVPGIVGIGKALEVASKEMDLNEIKIKNLRDEFEKSLLTTKKIRLNGHSKQRLFNISNVCFSNIDPFLIKSLLQSVAFSQGSACNSSSIKPSHVLKAMGLNDREASSSFRFSFGKHNTEKEIHTVIDLLNQIN